MCTRARRAASLVHHFLLRADTEPHASRAGRVNRRIHAQFGDVVGGASCRGGPRGDGAGEGGGGDGGGGGGGEGGGGGGGGAAAECVESIRARACDRIVGFVAGVCYRFCYWVLRLGTVAGLWCWVALLGFVVGFCGWVFLLEAVRAPEKAYRGTCSTLSTLTSTTATATIQRTQIREERVEALYFYFSTTTSISLLLLLLYDYNCSSSTPSISIPQGFNTPSSGKRE